MRTARSVSLLLALLLSLPAFAAVSLQPNTDRPGGDYRGFALDAPQPELCRQACADDDACQAFTYAKPGIKGPRAMCFLKSSAVKAVANACCTSGARSASAPMARPASAVVAATSPAATRAGPVEGRICSVTCAASVTTVSAIGERGNCAKLLSYPCFPNTCDNQGASCRTGKCNAPSDCASGASCNEQTGECVVVGNRCSDAFTVIEPHRQEHDCRPYRCQAGACMEHCMNDGECANGYSCQVATQKCMKQ